MVLFEFATPKFVIFWVCADDEDSGDDEEEENKPQLDTVMIQHHGAINRTRVS